MSSSIAFALVFFLLSLNPTSSLPSKRNSYVQNACSVTHYRDLCAKTLSPFASVAKNSPSKWARAGVSVAITDNKDVLRYLLKTRLSTVGKRDRVALSDCRELLQDSLDSLHKSLAVLRTLKASEFQQQMSDLATWLSTSLTDKDTCIDGFEKTSSKSSTVRMIRRRVTTSLYISSNSLALLNKLAANGL
ncbi:PREDICTED: 21 kDa protein-like [Camelina sativa]|uniref:21 kDa protein-like n=1 Tax=Camelina sativa TaxID=90675 RepID=A0ABM0ZAB5_CAMSA|nr:PREDICTED: 21 kDa protein-like [Camelina sativa]